MSWTERSFFLFCRASSLLSLAALAQSPLDRLLLAINNNTVISIFYRACCGNQRPSDRNGCRTAALASNEERPASQSRSPNAAVRRGSWGRPRRRPYDAWLRTPQAGRCMTTAHRAHSRPPKVRTPPRTVQAGRALPPCSGRRNRDRITVPRPEPLCDIACLSLFPPVLGSGRPRLRLVRNSRAGRSIADTESCPFAQHSHQNIEASRPLRSSRQSGCASSW